MDNNNKIQNSNQEDMWSIKLLPWEEVQKGVLELFRVEGALSDGAVPSDNCNSNADTVQKTLDEIYNWACSSTGPAKRLHEFAVKKSQEKLVKIVSTRVPPGICKTSLNCQIHDIKVDGGRNAPDDKIYDTNPDIRHMIARGTTLISWKDENNKDELDIVLYANKKFTGGVGDEDEFQQLNEQAWRNYCLSDPDEADKVVVMEKINGEAAHFSARFNKGHLYIITGSKNVHMLIGCDDDVDKYIGDRYRIANLIAKTLLKELKAMETKRLQVLVSLLHHTKSTVCCEILLPENQHIVNLSEHKEPIIKIIAFTPTITESKMTSYTALPPHLGLHLAQALKMPCASHDVIATHTVDDFIKRSRKMMESEGHVLYFVKCENGRENTIGLAKTKTEWYVLLRALREKAVYCFTSAKKKADWSLQDRINSTYKRFCELQDWLKFSDDCLEKWKKISEDFLKWLNEEINSGKEKSQDIRPKFPIIWEKFLTSCTSINEKIHFCYTTPPRPKKRHCPNEPSRYHDGSFSA